MSLLIERKKIRKAIGRSNLPDLDYTVNPYLGCAHGCIYCYARLYCERRIGENWGRIVIVKENLIETLLEEVRKIKRGIVALSTVTDAYQYIEEKEKLTRETLRILFENRFHVSIQTKSSLVIRDIDLLRENSDKVDVGLTITTLNDEVARVVEPNAPLPSEREKALEKLASEGIKTWIFLGPLLPGENFEDIVELAKETGSILYYDKYRIKPFMISGIAKYLADKAKKTNWNEVFKKMKIYCEERGVIAKSAFQHI
ncbi:MAG: radical SAM protein [Archaeoglobaceae archaeon]|nr:radical SAM protein [Archaeoglobaceae archaeon]MDW7989749.1 radical SAM protein [Archaeoglobaceae archaeon]